MFCDEEIGRVHTEARQQRPWPMRAQAAADALRRQRSAEDLDAARAAVEATAEELAAAEEEQAAAQASMDVVQAEAGRGTAEQPELAP